MKTIFLSFTIARSSVSDYFIELSNKLSEEFRVIIITNDFPDRDFHISPKIKIFRWPSRRPTKLKDFIFLIRKVKGYRPEVMISMFGSINIFLIVGFLMGIKHRIPWSRTISTQFPTKKSLLMRKRYLYRLATTIFANSKATKKDLGENFGIQQHQIRVVYNAVKEVTKKNKGVQGKKIVYVGNMLPYKGVDILLQAMPDVLKKFPQTELVLIGGQSGEEHLENLRKIAVDLNICDKVIFQGRQGKEKVLEEFSKAYLTVVPSLIEAFGFVVIESFSVKTPVVGSNTSGIAEIIRDGKEGFLFEPGNAADLSAKILELLQNEDLRDTFSTNCYLRFKEEFELKTSISRMVEELKKIMNEGNLTVPDINH